MAWNPAPEVAAARDAAKALNNAPIVVLIYMTDDQKIGMASYGRTRALCEYARQLGEHCFESAMQWGDDEKGGS